MTMSTPDEPGLLEPDERLEDWSPARRAAWLGLMETHRRVVRALARDLEAAGGRGYKVYELLAGLALREDGRMRMSELADHALLSQSRMSRLVDDLERDGLVERIGCGDDSRVVFVSITEAGTEVLDAARPAFYASVEEQLFGRLSEREVEELARIWGRVLADGRDDAAVSAGRGRPRRAASRGPDGTS
jgi:DNA-binding MarR family transcriptional regulator